MGGGGAYYLDYWKFNPHTTFRNRIVRTIKNDQTTKNRSKFTYQTCLYKYLNWPISPFAPDFTVRNIGICPMKKLKYGCCGKIFLQYWKSTHFIGQGPPAGYLVWISFPRLRQFIKVR